MACGVSTVVRHSASDPEITGSNPAKLGENDKEKTYF
jgi:hypothetical protein